MTPPSLSIATSDIVIRLCPLYSVQIISFGRSRSSFLGYVDLLGTTYSSPTLATGFGASMAQPLLREAYEAKAGLDGNGELLTAEEAEKLLDDCMKVLFYRDARSLNKVSGQLKCGASAERGECSIKSLLLRLMG